MEITKRPTPIAARENRTRMRSYMAKLFRKFDNHDTATPPQPWG
jgi:hypothetical protein